MTREQLIDEMRKHRYSVAHIAVIAGVSVHTVRAWLRPQSSKASRNMKKNSAMEINEYFQKKESGAAIAASLMSAMR